ncbi:unnamed protein product [Blepharisma stoltei]|uniref:Uncharacterized protein n=1 Tax=Blepharisma stoltei TaxID=1481888 RepID=A0AAU9JUR7_9CILI|nr:unnamed protein product [Blepharisma stoltei]
MYLAYTLSYIIESIAFSNNYSVIASYICIKFGCRIAAAVGALSGSLFLFASSFATNYYFFCILYGTYAGVISGMLNMPIIWACWEFFPSNIGLVSSFGISAYSLGPTIFGLIWTSLINPSNESPFITFPENKDDESQYFGSSVYDNVPGAIRWMSLIYLVSSLLGIYMVRSQGGTKETQMDQRTLTLKDVAKQKNFWLLSLNCFFSFAFYAYFVSEYKNFGHTKIKDDHFLSYLGSTGFLVGGVSRLLWGFAIDKYDWKRVSYVAIISQVFICGTIYYIASVKILYFIWSTLGFIFGSSTYLIIIVACKIIYPHDDWILSWSFLGFTLLAISLWGVELFIWPVKFI